MAYKYKHFIPQNIAPTDATAIGVYDAGGKKVHEIPLGRLARPNKEPLYSFGLVSDIHLFHLSASWNPNPKFENALTFFDSRNCAMCVVCGDLTQTGFYMRTVESDASTTYLDEGQMTTYYDICRTHKTPVYEIAGNHESYYSMPITNNLDRWETYTGNRQLHYTIEQGNDLFIFCGQSAASTPMSDDAFDFLSQTLADNQDKRCFVFVHPVWKGDSGDVNDVYADHGGLGGTLLTSWSKGEALKNLLRQYPNVVLFHGHTHIKFEEQAKDKNLNYTNRNGFHSVHIPSLGRPRDVIINGSGEYEMVYVTGDSQGYIVDVYDDCIVLNGWDFVGNKPIPLGTYRIET